MKNTHLGLLALMLCLVAPQLSFGQAKGFAFGIKGGVNLSKLSMGEVLTTRYDRNGNPYLGYNGQVVRDNLRESYDTRTGFVGGVYARFGKNLFIQPEVLVSTKGGSFDIIDNSGPTPQTSNVNVTFSNIDVPILIGLKGGPLRINAGPMASFRIGDNQRLRDAFEHYTSGSFNDAMSQAVYGYQFGAGLDILGFSLDVRREGSFNDVAAFRVNQNQVGGSSSTVRQRLNSWQVTLAMKLL
ncbi:porin family protein [Telluribacter humicola]|uniref:porin family protein n=1 Tax=Telluribacter humicola TaxID=1720261 RepID=UPI001A95963B|nr:porin family protein [Telluribacter humicola]